MSAQLTEKKREKYRQAMKKRWQEGKIRSTKRDPLENIMNQVNKLSIDISRLPPKEKFEQFVSVARFFKQCVINYI